MAVVPVTRKIVINFTRYVVHAKIPSPTQCFREKSWHSNKWWIQSTTVNILPSNGRGQMRTLVNKAMTNETARCEVSIFLSVIITITQRFIVLVTGSAQKKYGPFIKVYSQFTPCEVYCFRLSVRTSTGYAPISDFMFQNHPT